MDLLKDKYIIVEVIPTSSDSEKGIIAQLSALKLEGIKLLDRFDYRIDDSFVDNNDLLEMISYDKENFKYTNDTSLIIEKFKEWIDDLPILLIENDYTKDYLKDIDNHMELVYPYLNVDYNYDVFNTIMTKYGIAPSNYLVDIIYEAIIAESNNK